MVKRLIFWLALACLTSTFVSCATKRMKERICNECCPKLSDSISTKTNTTITKHDTDITEPEKDGPKFNIVLGDNCDSIKERLAWLEANPLIIEKNGIKATTKYDSKKKAIETTVFEDAHKIHLANALVTIGIYKEWTEKLIQEAYCKKEHLTDWDKTQIHGFWIELGILILYILYRCRKMIGWIARYFP